MNILDFDYFISLIINSFVILFLIVLFILISPFFFRHLEIGTCVGMDILKRRTVTIENRFEKFIKTITNGDLVLITSEAREREIKHYYFEAILIKDLEIPPKNEETEPCYLLLKNSSVRVNKDLNKEGQIIYTIRIVSFERDGKRKSYEKKNVSEDYFSTNHNFNKYNVFSKHANHVVKQLYIEKLNLKSLDWYFAVLSIYYQFFITTIFNKNIKNTERQCTKNKKHYIVTSGY